MMLNKASIAEKVTSFVEHDNMIRKRRGSFDNRASTTKQGTEKASEQPNCCRREGLLNYIQTSRQT
jgi:hypothetical protein